MSSIHQNRPLSPHLQIYRPQITSVLSITHRLTGIFLSLGGVFLVAWLWAAAYNAEYYAFWMDIVQQWYGLAALAAWSFAFYYHLCNGIRHLFWDMGKGFEISTVTKSGVAVVLGALALTALTWINIMDKVIL